MFHHGGTTSTTNGKEGQSISTPFVVTVVSSW